MEHIQDAHNHVYPHSHSDDHGHSHSREDGHVHTHPHTHSEGTTDLKETKALLSYMIRHNEHHAEELAALLDALPKNAQRKLILAIGSFEAANVQLQEVLDCLD